MAKKIKKIQKKVIKQEPPAKTEGVKKTRIRVIGIGGGGGSIVSEIASRVKKASFVVANTDLQALKTASRKAIRFQFGQNFTQGLGTGMNVELGEMAAQNEKEKIKKIFEGQDFCVIVACLGGGTGSGAAPIFAKISKALGNITFGIFTLPFKFEGEKKIEIAKASLEKIKPKLNALCIIPNERIFQIIDRTTPLKQALSAINKSLTESLEGLIETIYQPGLINIDFADLKTILQGQGRLAYLNTVEVQKKGSSAQEAIERVLNNPLYPYSIRGAKGVLFNIAGEKNLELSEVSQISKTILELVNKEAKIIFGISQSKKYQDVIKTTLLATGCQTKIFSKPKKRRKIKKISKSPKKTRRRKKKGWTPEEEKKPIKKLKTKRLKPILRPPAKRAPKKRKKLKLKTTPSRPSHHPAKGGPLKIKVSGGSKNYNPPTTLTPPPTNQKKVEEKVEPKIRKNALQIKKEAEAEEEEMLKEEKKWETPAFLRKLRSTHRPFNPASRPKRGK